MIIVWVTNREIEDKLIEVLHKVQDKLSFYQYMQMDRHFQFREVQEFRIQSQTHQFSEKDRIINDRTTLELVVSEICKFYQINTREVYP